MTKVEELEKDLKLLYKIQEEGKALSSWQGVFVFQKELEKSISLIKEELDYRKNT